MKEREYCHYAAPLGWSESGCGRAPQDALEGRGHEVGVREDRGFGKARGSSGELNHTGIFRVHLNPRAFGLVAAIQQFGEMMPFRIEFQALLSTPVEPGNIVCRLGDDHPGNLHLLTKRADIRKDHIEGEKSSHPR